MEGSKQGYSFMASHPSQPSVLNQGNVSKLSEGQLLQSLPSVSPHLQQSPFNMVRNFSPSGLPHLEDHEDSPFVYPRPNVTLLSVNRHHNPYHGTSASDINTYPFTTDSPEYGHNLHPPQPHYHLRQDVDSYPLTNQEVDNVQLTPTSSTLDLTVQIPLSTANPSLPPSYAALRQYHETQTRQHAQVLQQLTQSSAGRLRTTDPNSAKDVTFPVSYELDVAPVGEPALFPTCSIPMSNKNDLLQQKPTSHDLQHSHPSASQYQYPSNNDLHLGYPQQRSDNDLDDPDTANTHVFTAQRIQIYEETEQESSSAYHVSTTTIHAPIPPPNISTTISLHSTVEVLRSGVRSNTVHSLSHPDLAFRSSGRTTDSTKVSHPSASLPDLAALAASYVDTRNDQYSTKILNDQSKNGIQELEPEVTSGERRRGPHRDSIGAVNGHINKNGSRAQEGKRSRTPEKAKVEEDTTDKLRPEDELPPAKKKKKSKMHECQVCHKQFPRPSGLKTHMNTHNNERPYACHFPGCNRTFGVRSNAKRHLRTHGVIPPQNTGPQPYVVDFSTPMVLEQNPRPSNGDLSDQTLGSEASERTENTVAPKGRSGRGRGRQFKLRWMPPSSSSRTNAAKSKGKKKVVGSKHSMDPESPVHNAIHEEDEDYDEEDSDAQSDEGDMDLENEFDGQDDENFEGEGDADKSDGKRTGWRTEMQPNEIHSSSPQLSLSSSPRHSFSSSSGPDSGSTSVGSATTTSSLCFPSSWPLQNVSTMSDELKGGYYNLPIMAGSGIRNQFLKVNHLHFPDSVAVSSTPSG